MNRKLKTIAAAGTAALALAFMVNTTFAQGVRTNIDEKTYLEHQKVVQEVDARYETKLLALRGEILDKKIAYSKERVPGEKATAQQESLWAEIYRLENDYTQLARERYAAIDKALADKFGDSVTTASGYGYCHDDNGFYGHMGGYGDRGYYGGHMRGYGDRGYYGGNMMNWR